MSAVIEYSCSLPDEFIVQIPRVVGILLAKYGDSQKNLPIAPDHSFFRPHISLQLKKYAEQVAGLINGFGQKFALSYNSEESIYEVYFFLDEDEPTLCSFDVTACDEEELEEVKSWYNRAKNNPEIMEKCPFENKSYSFEAMLEALSFQ